MDRENLLYKFRQIEWNRDVPNQFHWNGIRKGVELTGPRGTHVALVAPHFP